MSNQNIQCLVLLPYLQQIFIIEIPETCLGKVVLEKIKEVYASPIEIAYLYDGLQKRIIDLSQTLEKQGINDGSILYGL